MFGCQDSNDTTLIHTGMVRIAVKNTTLMLLIIYDSHRIIVCDIVEVNFGLSNY
jgi:hypothetical protein